MQFENLSLNEEIVEPIPMTRLTLLSTINCATLEYNSSFENPL